MRPDECRQMVGSKTPVQMRDATIYNRIVGTGRIVAFTDAPQVCVEMEDGTRRWWRADQTSLIPAVREPRGDAWVRDRFDDMWHKTNEPMGRWERRSPDCDWDKWSNWEDLVAHYGPLTVYRKEADA